jgi:hypothetical protein
MEPGTEKPPVRIRYSLWTFAIAVAVVGPFALPLLWRNPRFSKNTKIIVSIAVILFTLSLLYGSGYLLTTMTDRLLGGLI